MTLELEDCLVSKPIGIAKDVSVKVGVFHFPADFMVVDFEPDPRLPLILGRCFLKTSRALIDVHKGELTFRIKNEAITYNLDQTSRYSANYNQMTANKIDVICEVYSQEVLSFSDVTASSNPTPYDDLVVSTTSPTLTPFGDSDFLLFEEADAFLGLEDDPNSSEFNPFYYDPEGDILLLKAIMNSKPLPPLPNHEQYMLSFNKELKGDILLLKAIMNSEPLPPLPNHEQYMLSFNKELKVELKDLPPYLEYAFLEGDNKLLVIIAKELGDEDKSALIKKTMEVFMDDFSVFGNSFKNCLTCKGVKTPILVLTRRRAILWSKRALSLAIRFLKTGLRLTKLNSTSLLNYLIPQLSKDDKARLLWWALLLQEFDFKVLDTKGAENLAADHLSRLENLAPWFPDFANYHAGNFIVKGNKCILVAVDYLSKWVEAKALPTNDARVVCKFLKSIFARFGAPRAIISDRGTHFCNDQFAKIMLKYEVTHRLSTAYHPQTSGKVEVSNRSLKRILERTIDENCASWSDKLDDALWAFRTTYKTPIECTPYKLVYGKACHLSIELEHKAYWALKQANFDLAHAYENSLICKEKTKRIHDSKIKNRVFNVGDRVLLFNSRLKIFSGKLKTHWSGPFTITKVFPYGTDCPDCKVSRALSFCPLFTRASHPQLYFGNPKFDFEGWSISITFQFSVGLQTPDDLSRSRLGFIEKMDEMDTQEKDKNKAKNDKIEHEMEKIEKDKVSQSLRSTKVNLGKVKV
nr:reverse transcriptase domain-containing protein [Tanacetum cinerariifolium]